MQPTENRWLVVEINGLPCEKPMREDVFWTRKANGDPVRVVSILPEAQPEKSVA